MLGLGQPLAGPCLGRVNTHWRKADLRTRRLQVRAEGHRVLLLSTQLSAKSGPRLET